MSNAKFRYPYSGVHERFTAPTGNRFRDKLMLSHSEDGHKTIKKIGEIDSYGLIQSYRESCDLQSVLQRCMNTGDYSALQKVQGVYFDSTNIPTDFMTAQNVLLKARLSYEGLSSQLKTRYGSFNEFLEAFASTDGVKAFIDAATASTPVSNDNEVLNNES